MMTLKDEIEKKRKTIHSDGYPMSIGELANMYRDGEIEIHPEFQRFFRWTNAQKSRLIESLLLGIPIPSIFVSQRIDGVWDVIDGLQRLSTIFEFMGLLRDEHNKTINPLILEPTKYLPSLGSKVWEDLVNTENDFGRDNQLIVKRAKIDVKIILRESDEASKYELFQRVNTGGSPLSDQELRNCILIMTDRDFYRWLVNLSKDENFNACIALTDRAFDEQYNLELIVRFLIFRKIEAVQLKRIGDLGDFLTDTIVEMAKSSTYDKDLNEQAFRYTFKALAISLEDDSFRRYAPEKGRFLGGFLISAYEVLAIGLGHNYEYLTKNGVDLNVKHLSQQLWTKDEFLNGIGSGVGASSRIQVTIPLGRSYMRS